MKSISAVVISVGLLAAWLGLPGETGAESSYLYYRDPFWVDLKIGDGGEGKKYELYRDDAWQNQWQNETDAGVYCWDYPGPTGEYYYEVKYFDWNEQSSLWEPSGAWAVWVDTYYTQGFLHNSEEWQDRFGRGPISWLSGEEYRVRDVDVMDGTLDIDGADVIGVSSIYHIEVMPGAYLHADGASFTAGSGCSTWWSLNFNNQSGLGEPVIENSTFNRVEVDFSDCTGVEVSNNALINDSIISFYDEGGENQILNNRGSGRIYIWDHDCTVSGNEVDEIEAAGNSNLFQGNSCQRIWLDSQASGNRIIGNTVDGDSQPNDRIYVYDDSTNITIQDNYLLDAYIDIECGDNHTIQGNTIVNGFISVWNSDTNLIKQNRIIESSYEGIRLGNSSFNNIEDNNIDYSEYEGIKIGNEYNASHYNVLAFNHVYGGCDLAYFPAGISIVNGEGNGVHENISEDYYYGVQVGSAAADTWVYNNLFRDNQRNAVDDGTNTIWNKPKTDLSPGHNIVGGPYLGGNYWSDYTGTDGNGDKLGDTPYPIRNEDGFNSATDNLPLIWVSMPSPTPGPTPETVIIGSGDYDGDGTSDVAVFRSGSGLWAVRGFTRVYFGASSDIPAAGDYDGDGTAEIAVFRNSSGLWAVRGFTRAYFGSSSDTAVPGDYDGDRCCDLSVFRPGSGLWASRGVTRIYFGAEGDLPLPGDYDGDGKKEAGIFRGDSGLWALRGVSRIYFGSSSDTTVPGDYSGDGTWGAGIFRPSSGLWAIRGLTRSYFGSSSDDPVPAEYGGDGSDRIAVFRSSSGLWAIRGISRVYYGTAGDIPVTR